MTDPGSAVAAIAGHLANSPVPELLAYAFNQSFTGTLVLESERQVKSAIAFVDGAVGRAHVSDADAELAREALSVVLPADKIRFAEQHARGYGVGLFEGVARLALLSKDGTETALSSYLTRQVGRLCKLPGGVVYGFFPDLNYLQSASGPSRPLEPFATIVGALLAEPAVERCRQQLAPFKHERLALVEGGPASRSPLTGALRAIVARLRRGPHTFEELRLLNLAPEDELVAVVYALRITRQVTVSASRSDQAYVSGHSRVPRAASSQSLAAVTPPPIPAASAVPDDLTKVLRASGSSSPRLRAVGAASPSSDAQRAWQERTAEAKALEAWAMAEGDEAQVEKASAIVEKVAQLFPRNARIRFYNACLHKRAARVERAMEEFRRVLELEPGDPEARRELDLLAARAAARSPKGVFGRFRGPR